MRHVGIRDIAGHGIVSTPRMHDLLKSLTGPGTSLLLQKEEREEIILSMNKLGTKLKLWAASQHAKWLRQRLHVLGLVVVFGAVLATPSIARLPEEGLRRAQEAEHAVRSGRVADAIRTLAELDARYPNEPAVQLRLAELYDGTGQSGAALYYYRRYLQLTGSKAREGIRERVQTLEMTAGAREAADEIARRIGKKTAPQPTPETRSEQVIEKLLPDGRRVRVDSPQELMSEKPNPAKIVREPAVSPSPRHPLAVREVKLIQPNDPQRVAEEIPTNEVGSIEKAYPSQSASVNPVESAELPIEVTPTPKVVFTPPPLRAKLSPEDEQILRGDNASARKPASTQIPGEDARLRIISSNTHVPDARGNLAPTAAQVAPELTERDIQSPNRTRVEVSQPSALAATAPAADSATPTYLGPSSMTEDLFAVSSGSGEEATLVLGNDYADTVVTFVALPADGTDPVNVILGIGETRTVTLAPGRYEVRIHAMNNRYPPATVLRQHFDFVFQPAKIYTRRFTPEQVGAIR